MAVFCAAQSLVMVGVGDQDISCHDIYHFTCFNVVHFLEKQLSNPANETLINQVIQS